jgi:DNA processing protein
MARLFPPRNRIISGFADIVLVVEARKRSGTLITVDMALEQGREIFAVPGRITDRLSDGCNDLIRQGAGVACTPEDIIDIFGITTKQTAQTTQAPENKEQPHKKTPQICLNETEKTILECMDVFPMSSSQIIEAVEAKGLSETPAQLLPALTMMQLKGLIEADGTYYIKKW